MDQWEKTSRDNRELRLALVAGGQRTPEEMFPEVFGPAETTQVPEAFEDPEAAIDFSGVVYEPMTEEAYQAYEALLMEAEDGVSTEEVEQDAEWV